MSLAAWVTPPAAATVPQAGITDPEFAIDHKEEAP